MAVVAPDFVPVVLGQSGAGRARVAWLSLAGVGTTLQTLNWATTQAMGRPGVMLRFRLFSTPVTLLGFVIGLHWGSSASLPRSPSPASFSRPSKRTSPAGRSAVRPGMCEARRWSYVWAWAWLPLYAAATRARACRRPSSGSTRNSGPFGIVVYGGLLLLFAPRVVGELRTLAHRRA
jgi:hypothetical protein